MIPCASSANSLTVRDANPNPTDLNIPLPASQAVFSATRPTAPPPMTQSAAAMMGTTTQYSTACAPLDRLLGGGLKRGHILEINGPPGSGKEQIAANAVTSFVDANQEVLFVGKPVPPRSRSRAANTSAGFPSLTPTSRPCRHAEHGSPRHNQENPDGYVCGPSPAANPH